jgi:hypothetical protein
MRICFILVNYIENRAGCEITFSSVSTFFVRNNSCSTIRNNFSGDKYLAGHTHQVIYGMRAETHVGRYVKSVYFSPLTESVCVNKFRISDGFSRVLIIAEASISFIMPVRPSLRME